MNRKIDFTQPDKSKWLFLFLLLIVSLVYNYHNILFRPPGVIHQWRQCDCLSIAANYYHFNLDFLHPAVYFASNDGSGATASEFPIIYYFVAFLWKIFGKHEIIFRLVNLTIVYCGLFFLFRFIEQRLKDSVWAIILVLLVFTSPIYVYYSNGFIMDPLGLSIAFIGWYFFGKFYDARKSIDLYLSLLFFLLAGLLKVSSTISVFAILALFILEMLGFRFRSEGKIFEDKAKQIIPFIVIGILLYLWYSYAARYNKEHGSGVFLVGIMPIWDYTSAEIDSRIRNFKGEMTLHQFFNIESIYFFFILFLAQFALLRKSIYFLISINVLLLFAVFAFLILWFGAVTEGHDYYLINLLIFVVFTFLSFFYYLQKAYPKFFSSLLLKGAFVLLLIYNIQLTSAKTAIRYFNTAAENYPSCYSKDNIARLQWSKYHFHRFFEPLRELSPYLRSIGVKQDDLVISLPDYSFDITLYFMNQKGWTEMSAPSPLTESWFQEKIKMGAKYLIINDNSILQQAALYPFTRHKIGSFKNVEIFDLRKPVEFIEHSFYFDLENLKSIDDASMLKKQTSHSGLYSAFFTPTEEYGLILNNHPANYPDLPQMYTAKISAQCLLFDSAYKGSIAVFQIKNEKDSTLFWKPLDVDLKQSSQWQQVSTIISFNQINIKPTDKIDIYLWNSQKKNIAIDDIGITYSGYK